MDKEPSFEKVNIEKEGHGFQFDTIMHDQGMDDLPDLSKQIFIYQRIEE